MKSEWKEGDVVRLKSGGPLMTVQHKSNGRTNEYRCTWFDDSAKFCSSVFRGETLSAAELLNLLQK